MKLFAKKTAPKKVVFTATNNVVCLKVLAYERPRDWSIFT